MARLKVGKKSFHNYQGMLFGTVEPPASNSPSFMARIRSKLWDTFSKVQHVAAEYFAMKGSSPIIKTEFIQPTYKKFVEDILTRFQNYHQQCEEVWVQQVEDFMSLVVQVQDSVHNYEHRFAEEFHELKKEYIKKYLGAAALDLAEKLKENTGKLEAMEKKLMPLHGHPGNGRLLNALTTQANVAAVAMKEDLDFYVRKTKKEFHEEFIKICQQSKIAYGCLDNVLSELKSSEILKQLRAQKKSYLAAQKSMALQSRSTTVAIEPVPVDHRLSLDSQALNEWLADSEIQIPILKKMSYVSIDTKQSEMKWEGIEREWERNKYNITLAQGALQFAFKGSADWTDIFQLVEPRPLNKKCLSKTIRIY
ncbi:hypothetical protein C0J52_12597 [Blattella germanica]|nr:hypothetical protein C0J52_12597 [Blattella germanica]